MISCTPKSLFSGNFVASGLASGSATVEFDWLTEQGRIGGAFSGYEIRKHGAFSGRWTLERAGAVVAEAHKGSAMFRNFVVTGEDVEFTLRPESAFTRAFQIIVDRQVRGCIRPAHAFTRRASIECSARIPEPIQLFAFWLVALTWRRGARNNAAGAS